MKFTILVRMHLNYQWRCARVEQLLKYNNIKIQKYHELQANNFILCLYSNDLKIV